MKYQVTINDRTYEIEVEQGQAILLDEYAAPAAPSVAPAPAAPAPAPAVPAAAAPAAPPAAAPAPVAAGGEVVPAPMPGMILSVHVQAEDRVRQGQLLVILEAMKMENEIVAAKDGVITQVSVAKGTSVNAGEPLVMLA